MKLDKSVLIRVCDVTVTDKAKGLSDRFVLRWLFLKFKFTSGTQKNAHMSKKVCFYC